MNAIGTSSILVLDDKPDDRQLLATVLGHAGYGVREASTGEQALALARAELPDLIITDILMPSMNGYEFVRRLRAEPDIGGTSVVFWTANYREAEVRRLANACGVSRFLEKPSDPETIVSTVGDVLGSVRTLPEPLVRDEFDREQLRVVNDKLVEKVSELESGNAERRSLIAQLVNAHEEERERIAEELHDDSIQVVATLGMRLDLLARRVTDPELASALERLKEDVALAVDRLRRLMFDLKPVELEREGLAAALELYMERAAGEESLAYELVDRTGHQPSEPTLTLLYAAGREALANVRKHADASHVSVLLEQQGDGFSLAVRDDGKGFSPADGMRVRSGHLGLPAMRERVEMAGGSLRLESRPGAGATLEVRLPDTAPEPEAVAAARAP